MTEFTGKPLGVLDNIYRFVGGLRGLSRFALRGAIQPVHDVSRQSELGSGLSQALGYFMGGANNVHAGAGSLFDTFDPYAQADFHGVPRGQVGVWAIDAMAFSTVSGGVDRISVGFQYPTIAGAVAGQTFGLREWDDDGAELTAGGIRPGRVAFGGAHPVARFPIFIPNGSVFQLHTDALIASTLSCFILFWAGAYGSRPPA